MRSDYGAVFCKNGKTVCRSGRGIAPVLSLADEISFRGFSVADKIVGKAAALLFVKMGISEVYGEVMSRDAAEILKKSNIAYGFGTLCKYIVNRQGDGKCPMEQAVSGTDDPTVAVGLLKDTLKKLKGEKNVE